MKPQKCLYIALAAALALLVMVPPVFAGGGIEPPPPGATITGPEIWGVVVMNCPSGGDIFATVRVKRVVDCNTETEAKADPAWPAVDCPAAVADVEGQSLKPDGTTFFGLPGTAFINKVKNFKKQGDVVSFDAQFKFWTP